MNVFGIRRPGEFSLPTEEGGELGMISLKWIVEFLQRRWMLIAAIATPVFIIALVALMLQPSKYTAAALMLMNPDQDRVLAQDQMITANGSPAAPVVDSQIEVLRSPALAGRLVDALGLVNDPEWNKALRTPGGARDARLTPEQRQRELDRERQHVVASVNDAIGVHRRGVTYAVEVSVTTSNPQRAALMANRLVDLFQQYQTEEAAASATRANSWLAARVADLRTEVQRKEAAAQEYQEQNGLLSTQSGLLTEQQTTSLQTSLMQARSDLAEKTARYDLLQRMVSSGASVDTLDGVLNSPVISALRTQEADIARREADLASRYVDTYPALVDIRAEHKSIRDQINAEIGRISAGMLNDVEVARSRLTSAQQSMNSVQGQLAGSDQQMVHLRQLQRDAQTSREVFEDFQQRYYQITGQGSLHDAPAQLVASASPPSERSSPKLSMSLVLSMALGLGIGLVAGFLVEALDEGLTSTDDLERKVGLSALASIPKLTPKELRPFADSPTPVGVYLLEKQMSVFAEAFRVLRASILFAAHQAKTQVVAITSATPNEGKTTTALCFGRVAALSGQRVMIIDCDLRRRTLKKLLNIEPAAGLIQVLSGKATWQEAAYLDEASGAQVLSLTGWTFNPKEIFGAEGMNRLIAELRESFDLIVLDCAPVLAVAETRVVAAQADCTLVIARWRKTPVRAIRAAIQQLQAGGAILRGVVINGVDRRAPYYYSYPEYHASEV